MRGLSGTVAETGAPKTPICLWLRISVCPELLTPQFLQKYHCEGSGRSRLWLGSIALGLTLGEIESVYHYFKEAPLE